MVKKNILVALLLPLAFSTIIVQKTFAQEAHRVDLTVSPTIIDLTTDPGNTIKGKFRIYNNVDTAVSLHLSITKLLPNGSYDSVSPASISPQDEFTKWLSFKEASLSARPKEWTNVDYTLAIPKTAAFGYYYGIKISQTTSATNGAGSKVQGEVIIPVLLNVRREGAVAKLDILEFKPQSIVNEYLPVTFNVRVNNVGNVHVRPEGNIFIKTGEKNLETLTINETQGNVLPGGTRTFTASWNDGFLTKEPIVEDDGTVKLDKNKQPITHLVVNWNNLTNFRIGKYTAHLLVVYDNGKRDIPLEAETTFWVFPYTIIGIGIAGIIAIIVIIKLLISLAIKREMKKYKKDTP